MNLILASASPRRKDILSKAGYDFKIIPSNYDEKICNKIYSEKLVENCAYNKALDIYKNVFKNNPGSIVIGADTVVVLDNTILGKPKDIFEAQKMLKSLSNKTHFVATSICLMNSQKFICATEKTFVTFRKLKDIEIINYVNNCNPLDKAGSYGIQDKNFDFAIKTDGELDNVIGFPLKLFEKLFHNF